VAYDAPRSCIASGDSFGSSTARPKLSSSDGSLWIYERESTAAASSTPTLIDMGIRLVGSAASTSVLTTTAMAERLARSATSPFVRSNPETAALRPPFEKTLLRWPSANPLISLGSFSGMGRTGRAGPGGPGRAAAVFHFSDHCALAVQIAERRNLACAKSPCTALGLPVQTRKVFHEACCRSHGKAGQGILRGSPTGGPHAFQGPRLRSRRQ
jgi:hypothetical protein